MLELKEVIHLGDGRPATSTNEEGISSGLGFSGEGWRSVSLLAFFGIFISVLKKV
jgi:hypothetical protein